ncbi:MAG TPA: alpha/beta hydrolase, partial [Microthrixaceae bacterium]|nr:alpha/beta hydrolase [Microthrixaceae bacterium]
MTTMPPAVHHTLSGSAVARLTGSPDPAGEPVQLGVHELGDGADRPAVVFSHGFPELAYSWRHQLPAVADAGFRAIAPDQRGYNRSSAPEAIEAYGLGQLCGDLVDLLDALEIDKAVFVGHDWGGFVVWAMPVLFPERCAGVAGICTPYTPFPGTDFLRSMFGNDEDMYMLWFQQPGVAEASMDQHPRKVFEKLMVGGVDPAILAERGTARAAGMTFNPFKDLDAVPELGERIANDEELDVYGEAFERTGFRGGINWYRNIDANGTNYPGVGTQPLDLPT